MLEKWNNIFFQREKPNYESICESRLRKSLFYFGVSEEEEQKLEFLL